MLSTTSGEGGQSALPSSPLRFSPITFSLNNMRPCIPAPDRSSCPLSRPPQRTVKQLKLLGTKSAARPDQTPHCCSQGRRFRLHTSLRLLLPSHASPHNPAALPLPQHTQHRTL